MTEIEVYSMIEPISGMIDVSKPPKDGGEPRALFDRIRRSLGG